MKRIFLTGGDSVNWATDDDYRFVKKALFEFTILTDNPYEADIIHSVFWLELVNIDKKILKQKIVIAHIPQDVRDMLSQPDYLKVAPYVNYWVVPTRKAKTNADLLKINNVYIPYGIDNQIFFKISDKKSIENLKEKYNLPKNKYLIGSFQRDTEGADLKTPKYVKGPDIFLEITKAVYAKNKNIHIVLAGPRRFWLIKQLKKCRVPFTYIGKNIIGKDDLEINTLAHNKINELYNLIDLYVVSSRMEGGPKAILECAATQNKIISTDVGQARDILNNKQIYDNFLDATDIILKDIKTAHLKKCIFQNTLKTQKRSVISLLPLYSALYKKIKAQKIDKKESLYREIQIEPKTIWSKFLKIKEEQKRIAICYQFRQGPWGGGNQFLKALSKALKLKKILVENEVNRKTKIVLFNSFHFDSKFLKYIKDKKKRFIHRIDGPTLLVRGKDKNLDDKIFYLNNEIADITIFQSFWSLKETLRLGYKPVNPILIQNASYPKIFNRQNKAAFSTKRKIKLISSSWSDNPRKGGKIYKWLDENLDWKRYEYTFVGRVSEDLKNIKIIPPVPSTKVAKILKKHDIYITASDNDPCSNALIEALACGLPAIYLNRGGHPELVGTGGLGFSKKEEIPTLIKIIVNNYQSFQNLVVSPNLKKIAGKYLEYIEILNKNG